MRVSNRSCVMVLMRLNPFTSCCFMLKRVSYDRSIQVKMQPTLKQRLRRSANASKIVLLITNTWSMTNINIMKAGQMELHAIIVSKRLFSILFLCRILIRKN